MNEESLLKLSVEIHDRFDETCTTERRTRKIDRAEIRMVDLPADFWWIGSRSFFVISITWNNLCINLRKNKSNHC